MKNLQNKEFLELINNKYLPTRKDLVELAMDYLYSDFEDQDGDVDYTALEAAAQEVDDLPLFYLTKKKGGQHGCDIVQIFADEQEALEKLQEIADCDLNEAEVRSCDDDGEWLEAINNCKNRGSYYHDTTCYKVEYSTYENL